MNEFPRTNPRRFDGRLRIVVGLFVTIGAVNFNSWGAEQNAFVPNQALGFEDLVKAVSRSPEVIAATREIKVREAAHEQSRLWNNPVVDATWATIPIGRTNPRGLDRPIEKVPSYHVGVSYTFPLGKRGPLQAARVADLRTAQARRCAVSRQLAIDLAAALGNMAVTELRIAALTRLLEAATEQERQVQARAAMQLASGLEVDRAAIERGRLEQQLRAAESDLSEQRAACSASTGLYCARFPTPEQATGFLGNWVNVNLEVLLSHASAEQRPDVKALASSAEAARHAQTFYRRQKIPDPTVRVGYVHDQFWVSGAQPNALELTVTVPIPLFDWGQAGARSAGAEADGYTAERQSILRTTNAVLPALSERLEAQRERRKTLVTELIPRAQAVLNDVVRAYDTKLLSMNDVIQARRALLELMLEEIDGLTDAYSAVLGLRAQIALSDNEGCTP